MPLPVGTKLGPYEIRAPIGAGGMGEVWQARDTRLNRIVAIKQIRGAHRTRFKQEARAIAALNHPYICHIYDVGEDYLVLEYVEGSCLRGPLPTDEALKLALQVAEALEEAHSKGILHRDLKPGNIMVTPKGAVKLLDFGLAKLLAPDDSDTTRTADGTVLGTAGYMSPEQARGSPLDERSDIFSFGAVLYEVLAGVPPFSRGSLLDTLNAVVRDEPIPIQTSPNLGRIVMRCLRKVPSERFQTMTEVRLVLDREPFGLERLDLSTSVGEFSAPAVSLVGGGAGLSSRRRETRQQTSIAVLPFANLRGDKEDEYFSDGLAEEIINALVKVPGLKVIARTSAFSFKGQNIDIRKIAEVLGVTNVLEGSVRRSGNRIRVTAQLIGPPTVCTSGRNATTSRWKTSLKCRTR